VHIPQIYDRQVTIMAKKTLVHLVDDLDGSAASESVSFGLDGVDYTIDLSTASAKHLREALAPFVARGRRVTRIRWGDAQEARITTRAQNQAVRAWARDQGEAISDRGRISRDLVARFRAAQRVPAPGGGACRNAPHDHADASPARERTGDVGSPQCGWTS